jgi:hypothetical protein
VNETTPAILQIAILMDDIVNNLPELFQAIHVLFFLLMCKVTSVDIMFITCVIEDFNLK